MLKNKLYFIKIAVLVFVASFLLTNFSQAALVGDANQAILRLSPETGSFNAGDNFSLSVYLNTNNQSIVAVAAYLNYDKTHFQTFSIDTSSSVFNTEAEKIVDSANGIIKITRGKPTPGVNTSNGLVAKINFRALSAVSPAADNFVFQFTADATNESNVIKDNGLGTDILSGVYNGRYTINNSNACIFTYSDWSTCQSNNTQSRTLISVLPSNCPKDSPILSQSCAYMPRTKCITNSDCYPLSFVPKNCGPFYTCSTDGKCYEGSKGCPIETIPLFNAAQIQAEILAVQKSLLELIDLIKINSKNPKIPLRLSSLTQKILEISTKIQNSKQKFIFTRNLYLNIEGEDVKKLQEFLAKDILIYPEGIISGHYELSTQKAVQRFQCKHNIICSGAPETTGYGRVGPKTMAKLNELNNN